VLINEEKEKSGKCARFWHVGGEKYMNYFGSEIWSGYTISANEAQRENNIKICLEEIKGRVWRVLK
jgi:hypothetical protein